MTLKLPNTVNGTLRGLECSRPIDELMQWLIDRR